MRRIRMRIFGAALLFAVALAAYTIWDNQRIVVREYAVTHPQVPPAFDGYRIVFVSDLEGRTFGDRQSRLVQRIVEQRPDLVVLGGDYIDEEAPSVNPVATLVTGLRQSLNAPIYFVLGPKDRYVESDYGDDTVLRELTDRGARYLNGPVRIERGSDHTWLAGLRVAFAVDPANLPDYFRAHPEVSYLEREYVERGTEFWYHSTPSDFVIVVDHKPLPNFSRYLAGIEPRVAQAVADRVDIAGTYTDHDLYLAGHTHGGQIRLPFIGPLVHPDGRLFPGDDYVKGLFVDEDGRYQIVGAGLGASGPRWARFRFLNPPEIVLAILTRP